MKWCALFVTAGLTLSVSAGGWLLAAAPRTDAASRPLQTAAWPPQERLLKWDPGVRGGIPAVPVAVELSAADLPGDGKTDISAKLQRAIDKVKAPGTVVLPAGTFLLADQISLKSGVVLRGAGMDRTHLGSPQELIYCAMWGFGKRRLALVKISGFCVSRKRLCWATKRG